MRARGQHHQAIEAERDTARLRHAGKGGQEILVDRIGLLAAVPSRRHGGLETAALFGGVRQFAEAVGDLDPAHIKLEALRQPRVGGARSRQGGLGRRVEIEHRRPAEPEMRFDPVGQDAAEHVRPAIVGRRAETGGACRGGEARTVSRGAVERRQEVDAGVTREGFDDADPFGLGIGVGLPSAKAPHPRSRGLGRDPKQGRRIRHQLPIGCARAVPLEHGEFGMMRGAALAVAKNPRQREQPRFAGRQQLLHGEFGRRVEVEAPSPSVGSDEIGPEGFEMRLVAGRNLQDWRLGLEKVLRVEPSPNRGRYAIAGHQEGAAVGEDMRSPGRRARRRDGDGHAAEGTRNSG